MTSVQGLRNTNNLYQVNFKRQTNQNTQPMVYTNPQADKFEKEQKKQKWKNGLITGLSVASTALFTIFLATSLKQAKGGKEEQQIIKMIKSKLKNVKNLAIKQQVEAELAMNPQERNLTRAQNLIKLDELAQTSPERNKADIKALKASLDKNIVGLDDAKSEFITAMESLNYDIEHGLASNKEPLVICFDGPPGTCKTTLAKEAAEAFGMYFKKIPCGGIKDAETIIGFKRTYMGSQSGAFAEAQIESGSKKVFYCLDEIDRVEKKGVLDALLAPFDTQALFTDQYYGANIDLSQSVFALTTNDFNKLPEALRNRVKIVHIDKYSTQNKSEIIKSQLGKKLEKNKLSQYVESISDDIYDEMANLTTDDGGRQSIKLIDELIGNLKVAQQRGEISDRKKVTIDKKYISTTNLGARIRKAEELAQQRAKEGCRNL